MSENYEPNASGIVTVQSAFDQGAQGAKNAISGMDQGQQIQQQIIRTQAMKQELQQKMLDNHDAMVNHVGQQLYQLAGADDDDKKGPVWKMQRDETIKKLQSLGSQVDPSVFDAYMKDPEHSGKFKSALAVALDPKADPHTKAASLYDLHNNFGSMEEAIKAPDEVLKANAAVLAANNKVNNTFQTRADKIRDQVKGINQKWDTTEQFTDNALNILNKPGLAQTGPGQTLLQEAYTRSGSGSAIRSFTLQLGQDNRSLSNKMMGALDKMETGAKLQPDELKAMGEGLKIFKGNANKYRDNEASPYYQSAKTITQQSKGSQYEISPNQMLPDDQWSRLADLEDQKNNPAPAKASKSAPAPSGSYSPGDSKDIDSFLKGIISNGATLQQVNKVMSRKKLKISSDDYKSLGGQ